MSSLEDRLRRVEGVSDLAIELDDKGLRGIRVKVAESSSEAEILEEIRRILVAYGLRSRKTPERLIPRVDTVETFEPVEPLEEGLSVVAQPDDDGIGVVITSEGRRISTHADRSPLGATEAMVRAVAAWNSQPMPERVALLRTVIDDERLLIVLAKSAGRAGIGAAVVGGSLTMALHRAVSSSLAELS